MRTPEDHAAPVLARGHHRVLLALVLALASSCGGETRVPRLTDYGGVDAELAQRIQSVADAAESGDGEALVELAMLYDANLLWEQAAETYALVPGWSEDARMAYHLGRSRATTGDAAGALEAFGLSIALVGDYAPSHWRSGDLLYELGRFREAEAAYARAVALAPGETPAKLGLARIRLAEDDPEGALAVLEPVVADTPRIQFVNGLLARAYRQLGEDRRAERALRREEGANASAVSDPWTAVVLRHAQGLRVNVDRASAALHAGDGTTAILVLEELYREHPAEQSVVELLANAYVLEKRHRDALALLDGAEVLDPSHFRLALARGRALAGSGQLRAALPHLEAVVRDSPGFGEGWNALGETQLGLELRAEAAASFAQAVENGSTTLRDWTLLVRTRNQIGRYPAAIDAARRALEDYPNAAVIHVQLADAQARSGDAAGARASLAVVEERDPENPLIASVRARIAELEERGDG